jgi:hypothetical protein
MARPVDPEELAFRAFTLQLKEGKGVETETIQRKTLTEAEKRAAGSDASEDEPLGAEQGAVENGSSQGSPGGDAAKGGPEGQAAPQKMPGVAGGEIPPDPPPKYHMGFDGELSIWVVADVPRTPAAAGYESFLALAREVGVRFAGSHEEVEETRITVRLPLALAQQIYRQLLPGQRLLITQ